MAEQYKPVSIPGLPPDTPRQLRQFLSSLKEAMEVRLSQRGNALDAAPTFRDLLDAGVLNIKDGLSVGGKSYTAAQLAGILESAIPGWITSDVPPPAPTGFSLLVLKTQIELRWDQCDFDTYKETEVWRSDRNNLSSAVKIGSSSGASYLDAPPAPGTSAYYWIRHAGIAPGLMGEFNGVPGLPVAPAPEAVYGSYEFSGENVVLSWPTPTSNIAILFYELSSPGLALAPTGSNTQTVRVNWLGSKTISVRAVDVQGNTGPWSSIVVTVLAPSSPLTSHEFRSETAVMSWSASKGSLPIARYRLYQDVVDPQSLLIDAFATSHARAVSWLNKTFYVSAVDTAGNASAPTPIASNVMQPPQPVMQAVARGANVVISWTRQAGSLPVTKSDLRYGASFEGGVKVGEFSTTEATIVVNWLGPRSFWVVTYDTAGNASQVGAVDFVITAPPAPSNLGVEVVDNNVLLRWGQSTGTMPVLKHELRRGVDIGSSELIGEKSGGFTTVFESVGGSYTYWLRAIDTAGNAGAYASVTALVSQPPDYVLAVRWRSSLGGVKSNAAAEGDSLFMPVNTAEGFEEHFASRAWPGPGAQVAAGYPIFIQPSVASGYYEESFDYGQTLAAMKVSVSYLLTVLAGAVSDSVTITTAQNAAFTVGVSTFNGDSVFATNFRHVRVRISVSASSSQGVAQLSGLTVVLDAKLKSDSGVAQMSLGGAHAQGNIAQDYLTVWTPQNSVVTPPAGFNLNGGANENRIAYRPGPSGQSELVWVCVEADPESNDDGGWNAHYVSADCTKGHLYAAFFNNLSHSGTSYFGCAGNVQYLGGGQEWNPYFWIGDTPALGGWYLAVGYVHPIGYAGPGTSYSGLYDLSASKVQGGTDWRFAPGADVTSHRAYNYYNPNAQYGESAHIARPVIIPCAEANIAQMIQYLIRCAAGYGAAVNFSTDFVDIDSIMVAANTQQAPMTAVYDFVDSPSPKRFNAFAYNQSGVLSPGSVSYSVTGY